MIKSVLIDLDGTLLENNNERFLSAYLRILGEFLSDVAPSERIIQELLAGTRAMVENNDPTQTLRAIFAAHFYPSLGLFEQDLAERLGDFYRELFPGLKDLTRPVPGARRLVEWALQNDLEVVIATSPLFPLTAIEQRLDWAGLPVSEFPYALVTSFETSHFSKPNIAYFAEILGRLGRSPEQAVMLGDDIQLDLQPASELGIAAFRVLPTASDDSAAGTVLQAIPWIESAPVPDDGPAGPPRPDVILARMRADLAALTALAGGLAATRWRNRPEPASWSPVEIVCHLRDVEREVNAPRYRSLINQSDVFVPAADPDRWAAERGYIGQDGQSALSDFCRARLENIQLLEATDPAVWSRSALHALLGPTDLAELASFAADHDTLHLDQLRRALAARPA
jgi:phosphoglycolate phosphatase-like HAD superfamily hydrolase